MDKTPLKWQIDVLIIRAHNTWEEAHYELTAVTRYEAETAAILRGRSRSACWLNDQGVIILSCKPDGFA